MTASKYYSAHGKVVRRLGNTWKIIAHGLGESLLVQAEAIVGPDKGKLLDLKASRSNVAREIRDAVELGLVS